MCFVVAEMMHETNTFSPIPRSRRSRCAAVLPVRYSRAADSLAPFERTNTSSGGLIRAAREADAELTLPVACGAPERQGGGYRVRKLCRRNSGRAILPRARNHR